jgi:hypothetical protein
MKKIYLLFFIALSFSCGKTETPSFLNFKSETKDIKTFDRLGVSYKNYQLLGDTLVVYDSFHHEFALVDLISDTIFTIPLDLNGPNGFDSPIGFYFKEDRSFILADDFSIASFDFKGQKRKTIYLMNDQMYSDRDQLYGNPGYAGYRNHILYDPIREDALVYFQKRNGESKKRLMGSASLEDLKIRSLPIEYPVEYDEVDFTGQLFQLSTCQSEDGAYFVFSGSPQILYYDFETMETSSKAILSFEGKGSADPPLAFQASDEEVNEYLIQNPFYTAIYFDKHSNILYRISSPPMKSADISNPDFFQDRPLILTVMDKKMNVIGQLDLPKAKFDASFMFAYSEGIWISLKRSLQNDESRIQGELIQIEGVHY